MALTYPLLLFVAMYYSIVSVCEKTRNIVDVQNVRIGFYGMSIVEMKTVIEMIRIDQYQGSSGEYGQAN